jgi:hypothetical protein
MAATNMVSKTKKMKITRLAYVAGLILSLLLVGSTVFWLSREKNPALPENRTNNDQLEVLPNDGLSKDISFEIPGLVGNTRKVARKYLGTSSSGTYGLFRLGGDAYPTWGKEGCPDLKDSQKIQECQTGFKNYETYVLEHGGTGLYYFKIGSDSSQKIPGIEFNMYDPIDAGWDEAGESIWWMDLQQGKKNSVNLKDVVNGSGPDLK